MTDPSRITPQCDSYYLSHAVLAMLRRLARYCRAGTGQDVHSGFGLGRLLEWDAVLLRGKGVFYTLVGIVIRVIRLSEKSSIDREHEEGEEQLCQIQMRIGLSALHFN